MMRQAQTPDGRSGFGNALGILSWVCGAFAVSVEVFLHRPGTFGDRYLRGQAALAAVIILLWPALCNPSHDAEPMLIFFLLYLMFLFGIRARIGLRRRRNEPPPHSYYTGTPRLMRLVGRTPETKVKGGLEPLIVCMIGVLMLGVSPPLGGYLMMASAGLAISVGVAVEHERRRTLDLHDSFLEQRGIAERFREMRGE